MKAYLFKQLWVTICILLAAVLVLSASFNFVITSDSGKSEELLEQPYTPISFLKDLWSLIQVNASAGTEQSIANIILFGICLILVTVALVEIVFGSLFAVVISIVMIFTYFISKSEFRKEMGSKMFSTGLFAPLLLWISTALFSFHFSAGLGGEFNVYTEYTSGFNFLIVFIALLVIYGIGNVIISRVCRD